MTFEELAKQKGIELKKINTETIANNIKDDGINTEILTILTVPTLFIIFLVIFYFTYKKHIKKTKNDRYIKILKERFAKGEINKEEFKERMKEFEIK